MANNLSWAKLVLCPDCSEKISVAFSRRYELRKDEIVGRSICSECRKSRYCTRYTLVPKSKITEKEH